MLCAYRDWKEKRHWEDRFKIWWDKNPFYHPGLVRGWGLLLDDNWIGFLAAIPFPIQVDSQYSFSASASSWYVEEGFRGKGYGKMLFSKFLETFKDRLVLNTTAAPATLKTLESFGFKPIRAVGETSQSFYPLRIPFPPVKEWPNIEVRVLDFCSDEFDVLWGQTKTKYSTTSIRNRQSLNWFCFPDFSTQKRLLGCYRKGILSAFMILQIQNASHCDCVDYWGVEENDELISPLVSKALSVGLAAGAKVITFRHFNDHFGNSLRSTPLFERKVPELHQLYLLRGKSLSFDSAYFTRFLGDHSL